MNQYKITGENKLNRLYKAGNHEQAKAKGRRLLQLWEADRDNPGSRVWATIEQCGRGGVPWRAEISTSK